MWKEKPYFQYIPKFQTKWKLSLENKKGPTKYVF